MRFSKLFGVGRTTSLPKIWKGTRKRKKTRSDSINRSLSIANDTVNEDLKLGETLQPIPEEGLVTASDGSTANQAASDDIFQFFEENFE